MADNITLETKRAKADEELFQSLLAITQNTQTAQLLMRNTWTLLHIFKEWAEKVQSDG